MATRSPKVIQAYIFRNGDFLGTDVFVDAEVIIGRDPEVADLVLESADISREHALLRLEGSTLTIEDLGSTNGVLVNDEEIERAKLSRLDEITIGDFSLKFKLVRGNRKEAAPKGRPITQELGEKTAVSQALSQPKMPAAQPAPVAESIFEDETRIDATSVVSSAQVVPKKAKASKKASKTGKAKAEKPKAEKSVHEEPTRIIKTPSVPGAIEASTRPSAIDSEATRLDEPGALLEGGQTEQIPMLSDMAPAKPKSEKRPAPPPQDEPESTLAAPDDDDDDDDDDGVPAYSLVEQLKIEDAVVGQEAQATRVEVITLRGDSVVEATLLKPGQSFFTGPKIGILRRRKARDLAPRVRLLKVRKGETEIRFGAQASGEIVKGGERKKLSGQDARAKTPVATLRPGQILDITDGPMSYHVRYVRPPEKQVDDRPIKDKLKPTPIYTRSFAGAFGTHLFVILVIGIYSAFFAPQPAVGANTEFVEVNLETDLELEEPEPEPEPEAPAPEPEPKPEPQVQPKQKAKVRTQKSPTKTKAVAGGTTKAPSGVLGLLSKRGGSKAPGPQSALAAASNLSAANAPGSKGGFRVSGLSGKLPTSSLSVGGGGGGPVTRGGAALLRGGKGGAGRLAGGSGAKAVRGRVTKSPRSMKAKGSGSLSRDEIMKVINRNVGQIQRCFERELLKNPGLAGKLQVEWTISTSGSVKSVRQSFATIKSPAFVSCSLGKIKGWRFPRPKGGDVVVTFPFTLSGTGF